MTAHAPLFLYGYGSYGFGTPATFASNRLSLLDRGMAYAIAHIRGGDEMGEKWREDGMLMKKKNTFFDFIDCAEYLIAQKWTSKDRLVIEGGSAGGLLMGAVVNMRPDLFHAVHAAVPFVDVMNTMMDASLPLTVGEYLEWGNPNEKAAYDYMKTYSPYDNLEKRAYPAILVTTSFNDSQVMYWEPAKYVARLRTLKTNDAPLLLEDQDGTGGTRRRVGALRPDERPGFRICLAVDAGGDHQVIGLCTYQPATLTGPRPLPSRDREGAGLRGPTRRHRKSPSLPRQLCPPTNSLRVMAQNVAILKPPLYLQAILC